MLMELLMEIALGIIADNELEKFLEDVKSGKIDRELYAEYAQAALTKDPEDPFGKIALALSQDNLERDWDMQRVAEVAEITTPLIRLIQKISPDARITMELDMLTQTQAVLSAELSPGESLDFFAEDAATFGNLIGQADCFSINPQIDEQLNITASFKDVRKIKK